MSRASQAAPPEAAFDVMFIADALTEVAGGATDHEIALFSYLSCLLSVYRGRPPADWGYRFTATRLEAPYSDALSTAVKHLQAMGLLHGDKNGVHVTDRGKRELSLLSQLRRFASRTPYLSAACNSALAIPLPMVGTSLSAEPQLSRAIALSSTRPLLDEVGARAIHGHFAALSRALPDSSDLFVSAVVWLSYLARNLDDGAQDTSPNEQLDGRSAKCE